MNPRAVILTIGNEILLGEVMDTNAAWLSRALVARGVEPVAHHTVGDALGPLVEALKGALARADVVVTTGGLGPTSDDTARQAAAEATGRPLELRPELLEPIRRRLAARGRNMGENNRRQAYLPAGAQALPNPVGTAPGFVLGGEGGALLICLPGIPFEMERVWRDSVEGLVRSRFPDRGALAVRVLKCIGAGESEVARLLGDVALGTATAALSFQLVGGEIHVRIVGQGSTEEAAWEGTRPVETAVRGRLGRLIYGHDDDTLASVVVGELQALGERVAAVEGASGGALLAALAGADPEGRVFVGGRVAPERSLWLTVAGSEGEEPPDGEARALSLARAAARKAGVVVGAAVTGAVAHAPAEPEAVYYLAGVWGERERVAVLTTSGPRDLIRRRAALGALDLLRRLLAGWPEAGP